jgi:hypothetical protein
VKFTEMVLDIIGGEKSEALHGIEGIEGDGEATITEATTSEECDRNEICGCKGDSPRRSY